MDSEAQQIKAEAQRIALNRRKAPRAARLADTLFELAQLHESRGIEDVAIRVDALYCQKGREIDWPEVKAAITEAAKFLA
jgi:hypothetical protein